MKSGSVKILLLPLLAMSVAACSSTSTPLPASGRSGYDAFLANNTPAITAQIACVKAEAQSIGSTNRIDDAETIAAVALTRCHNKVQVVEAAMRDYMSSDLAASLIVQNQTTLMRVAVADVVKLRS